MLCGECGVLLENRMKFCHGCGEKIDVEKSREMAKEWELKQKEEGKLNANPYVLPAFCTAILAFALSIFPYPPEWGIGTSLPMKLTILTVALFSSYQGRKAKRVNRLYELENRVQVRPRWVQTATVLSAISATVALFALFMGMG